MILAFSLILLFLDRYFGGFGSDLRARYFGDRYFGGFSTLLRGILIVVGVILKTLQQSHHIETFMLLTRNLVHDFP